MSDVTPADSAGGEPVFRLIYRSHSLIESPQRSSELGAIFTTARRRNRGAGITGALIVADGAFVQALEGAEVEVRSLFDVIRRDARHDAVTVLDESAAPRTFGRWAMAKVSTDEGPDIRLVSNARRGGIVAAGKDPSITPDQETVLSFMRESMAAETPGG